MTEENKYCGEIMKKGFKKLLKWPREIIKALKKPVDGGFVVFPMLMDMSV